MQALVLEKIDEPSFDFATKMPPASVKVQIELPE